MVNPLSLQIESIPDGAIGPPDCLTALCLTALCLTALCLTALCLTALCLTAL